MKRHSTLARPGSAGWRRCVIALVALVAWLAGTGPLAFVLHGHVQHVVCEHGELIDVGHDDSSERYALPSGEGTVSVRGGAPEGARGAHAHCELAARAHCAPMLSRALSIVGRVPAEAPKPCAPAVHGVLAASVWKFAPKTSPPKCA